MLRLDRETGQPSSNSRGDAQQFQYPNRIIFHFVNFYLHSRRILTGGNYNVRKGGNPLRNPQWGFQREEEGTEEIVGRVDDPKPLGCLAMS